MRPLAAAATLLLLAACAQGPRGEATLFPVYRDTDRPIASKAVFDPARYAGTWHEIARYPVPFEAGCVGVTADYALRADGTLAVANTCRTPGGAVRSRIEGSAEVVGPGRLKLRLDGVPFVAADYWVLWVAEDYGTAVVGTPSGRAGWILNRTPRIAPDRLAAAREMLDFNGYDLSRLEMVD